MKTVAICGSMRFSEEMKKIALELEIHQGFNVLDIDGYIGESVKGEIEYAKSKGKEVILHTQFGNE